MHTKKSLLKDLANMGLTGKETIMVHSSMKSIGEVEGRADTFLRCAVSYLPSKKPALLNGKKFQKNGGDKLNRAIVPQIY